MAHVAAGAGGTEPDQGGDGGQGTQPVANPAPALPSILQQATQGGHGVAGAFDLTAALATDLGAIVPNAVLALHSRVSRILSTPGDASLTHSLLQGFKRGKSLSTIKGLIFSSKPEDSLPKIVSSFTCLGLFGDSEEKVLEQIVLPLAALPTALQTAAAADGLAELGVTTEHDATVKNPNPAIKIASALVKAFTSYNLKAKMMEGGERGDSRKLHNLSPVELRDVFVWEVIVSLEDVTDDTGEIPTLFPGESLQIAEARLKLLSSRTGKSLEIRFEEAILTAEENKKNGRSPVPKGDMGKSEPKNNGAAGSTCVSWMRNPLSNHACAVPNCAQNHFFRDRQHFDRMKTTQKLRFSAGQEQAILQKCLLRPPALPTANTAKGQGKPAVKTKCASHTTTLKVTGGKSHKFKPFKTGPWNGGWGGSGNTGQWNAGQQWTPPMNANQGGGVSMSQPREERPRLCRRNMGRMFRRRTRRQHRLRQRGKGMGKDMRRRSRRNK